MNDKIKAIYVGAPVVEDLKDYSLSEYILKPRQPGHLCLAHAWYLALKSYSMASVQEQINMW